MFERLRDLRDDTAGATAIEYGLIAGFISLAILGLTSPIGDVVVGWLNGVLAGL